MEINDDALDFCQNLLSYTYNAYFRKRRGLQLQSAFDRIGEIVLHISYVHNATFKRILMQNFNHTCKSEVEFLRCIVGHSSKIVSSPCQVFLASAALLMVHMYMGFDKNCCRFLQTSSLCLYITLNRLLKEYRSFSQFYRDLVEHSGRAYAKVDRMRSLSDSVVEEHAPEPIRMLQRTLADRMHLTRVREDMDHQLYRAVPKSGNLQEIEIETVVNGDFRHGEDEYVETCTLCNTKCGLNYKMHLLDHQIQSMGWQP